MPSLANGCYTVTLPPDGSALAVRDGVLVVSLANFSGEIRILSHCPAAAAAPPLQTQQQSHDASESANAPRSLSSQPAGSQPAGSQPTGSQPTGSQQPATMTQQAQHHHQQEQQQQQQQHHHRHHKKQLNSQQDRRNAERPPIGLPDLSSRQNALLLSPSCSPTMSPVQSPVQTHTPSPTPSPVLAPLPSHFLSNSQTTPAALDPTQTRTSRPQSIPGSHLEPHDVDPSLPTEHGAPALDRNHHADPDSPGNNIFSAFLNSPSQQLSFQTGTDPSAGYAQVHTTSAPPLQIHSQAPVSTQQHAGTYSCVTSDFNNRGVQAQSPSQFPSPSSQKQVPHNKRARGCESPSSDGSWDDQSGDEDFPTENYNARYSQNPAAQTTVADKGASQGKRVRFADNEHSQVQEEPPQDDPKAPWKLVPTVPNASADTTVGSAPPSGRWGTSFTRINADIAILIGGESEQGGMYDEIHTLSLSARTWTQGLASTELGRLRLSSPRSWHSATRVGTSILVFGGEIQTASGEREQTSDLLSLDINYGLWVSLQSTGAGPSPRAGHCTALLPDGETLCVFGGISGSRWLADCHLLNVPQLEWKKSKNGSRSSTPPARSYATLTTVGEYVVLFGGNNKTRSFCDVFLGTVQDKKDSARSVVWTEPLLLGAGPAARTGHFAVASPSTKGAVIIGGGWDDLGAKRVFHPDIWELQINTRAECQWRLIHRGWSGPTPPPASQPGARAGAAVCDFVEDGEVVGNPLLFGGFRGFQYFSDAYELDLSKCC